MCELAPRLCSLGVDEAVVSILVELYNEGEEEDEDNVVMLLRLGNLFIATAVPAPAIELSKIANSCIYVYHLIHEYLRILASGKPQLEHR